MKIKVNNVLKFLLASLIVLLLFILRIQNQGFIMALALLVLSTFLMIKVKNDIYLIFMLIPIFYANYSIAIGEFINKNLQVAFNSIRFFSYGKYLDVLLMLCAFIVILFFFLKPNNDSNTSFQSKDNPIIFYALTLLALLINVFFFDRSESASYIVRSNSLHGYTFLLVLFMSYYSGNKKFRRILILVIVAFIAVQSLFYGGRQAVIPTVIITLITMFSNKLNYKNVLLITGLGIVVLTIIGQLRGTANVGLTTILELFTTDYFVQDTSVYAFNSSVTHAFAKDAYSTIERLKSFLAFLVSIFIGQGSSFTSLGNVTLLSDSINNNLGGGIVSSYFYFWLGWIGVLIGPLVLVLIINKLNKSRNGIKNLMLIGIVATASTWYLYSPLQFFRIIVIFVPIMYVVSSMFHKEIIKVKG